MEEIKTYFKNNESLKEEELFAGRSKRIAIQGEENDYNSYVENDISIAVFRNGALYLSDWRGEGCVTFYPDQLSHLQQALTIALQQRDNLSSK